MTTKFFIGVFLFFAFSSSSAFCQDQKFLAVGRSLSGAGVVHFVGGDSTRGQVAYINCFQVEVNGKTHSPKSIDSFYIYGQENSTKRSFLTLEYNDKRMGKETFFFFEVLFEFESFALLKKIDPSESYINPASTYSAGVVPASESNATYEQIYVFDKDGNTEVFLETRYLDPPPKISKAVATKIVNEKLLYRHLEPHLTELKKFAKKNKLSFEDKNDFLEIIKFYEQLVKA